jgi:hypothetical protein
MSEAFIFRPRPISEEEWQQIQRIFHRWGYLVVASNKPLKNSIFAVVVNGNNQRVSLPQPFRIMEIATPREYLEQMGFVGENSPLRHQYFYKAVTE